MRNSRKYIITAGAFALSAVLTACGNVADTGNPDDVLPVEGLAALHDDEFGGVFLKMSIDDFNDRLFAYGDSVDVEFSNGFRLEDIPYFNGYYAALGDVELIGYPGYDYIKATICNGGDLWDEVSVNDHETATVTLREHGKYLDIQNAWDIRYTDDRVDYQSDEVFANFRNIQMGNIRENMLYRGASPCDNQHNRAPYSNSLIQKAGVNFILDLADTDDKIQAYINADDFTCGYFKSLYEAGRVDAIALNMDYRSEDFARSVEQGFEVMAESEGPFLVHCTEGKDRTGFVCVLIEALAGASYEEIADDYMVTYDNYYGISQKNDPERYELILNTNLDNMLRRIVNDDGKDIKTADLSSCARKYLRDAGMSEEKIDVFLARITA